MITKAPHFLLFSEATDRTAAGDDPVLDSSVEGNSADDSAKYWHFVLRSPDGKTSLDVTDLEVDASAERLELLAVVRGLEALDQPSQVTLVTCGGSVRRGLRFGLNLWRENRWQWERFGKMTPIKNADLWRRIDRAMDFHDIQCRVIRFDPPADDLTQPVPKPLTSPIHSQSHRSDHSMNPTPAARLPTPPLTWIGRLMRRLFGWYGLCRPDPGLVIAAH